ncbi:MAG TPA: c-type cytochrome [Gemmatimonadaceae bacterium]
MRLDNYAFTRGRLTGAIAATTVMLFALGACGGGEKPAATDTTGAAPAPAGTTAASAAAAPAMGAPPAGATAAMVSLGDSIFHGQAAGGLCFTCHGADAKGGPLAPDLTDTVWLTGDGSYAFIQKRVTEGMPKPTAPYTAPMLPMGGAQLTPDQIKAVAAYVYTLSHHG